jgi:hypothetical protein
MRPEGLGNLIKIFHLIGSRTRDLIITIIIIIIVIIIEDVFWDMTPCGSSKKNGRCGRTPPPSCNGRRLSSPSVVRHILVASCEDPQSHYAEERGDILLRNVGSSY